VHIINYNVVVVLANSIAYFTFTYRREPKANDATCYRDSFIHIMDEIKDGWSVFEQ